MSSFSFEFRARQNTATIGDSFGRAITPKGFKYAPLIGEFFFVVGPMDYKEVFKYRISVEPTLGRTGNSVVGDFGIDNNIIELNGEFNLLHQGRPEVVTPTIPLATGSTGLKTGSMEFQDFLGLLYYVRYSNYIPQSIDTALLSSFFSNDNNFDHSRHILIFNDYDRGRRVEVVPTPDGITISRSTQDNFCYKWNMKLIVISDEANFISDIVRNPFNAIAQLTNVAKSIINAPLAFTGVLSSLSGLVKKTISSIKSVVDTYPSMQQQFNKDGNLIKNNFSGYKERQNPIKEYFNTIKQEFDRQANNQNLNDSVRGQINNSDVNFIQNSQNSSIQLELLTNQVASLLISRPPLMSLQVYALQPYSTSLVFIENNIYLSLINLTISINQTIANMVIASIDVNFYPYLVYAGDTFESISLKLLGDKSLAESLARYNNLKYAIAGSIIKIPFQRQLQVFAKIIPDGKPKTLEIALLGEDLKVTDNRDFEVDVTGDLDIEEGISCYLSNIIDLIETPVNSLPVHEWWGNPVEIAEIPNPDLIIYYKKKITEIIKSDRRTQSINFISESFEGDKLYIELQIFPIYNISPLKIKYSPSASLI